MPATITYSGMERRWLVLPGGGRDTLTFADEAAAYAARDAIDAGKVPVIAPAPAIDQDRTAFLPSRSTKIEGLTPARGMADLAEVGKRKLAPMRPMPIPALRIEGPAPPAKATNIPAPSPAARHSPATIVPRACGSAMRRARPDGLPPAVAAIDGLRAAEVYARTKSLKVTAEELGVDWSALRRRLVADGVTLNAALRPRADFDIERAKAIFAETRSLNITSSRMGMANSTLRRRLAEAGVHKPGPSRARGEAVTIIDIPNALRLFGELGSAMKVARALGVGYRTLSARFAEAHVALPKGVSGKRRPKAALEARAA